MDYLASFDLWNRAFVEQHCYIELGSMYAVKWLVVISTKKYGRGVSAAYITVFGSLVSLHCGSALVDVGVEVVVRRQSRSSRSYPRHCLENGHWCKFLLV